MGITVQCQLLLLLLNSIFALNGCGLCIHILNGCGLCIHICICSHTFCLDIAL